MPIEIAQQNLGHASLATTTAYVTTESKRRMRAVRARAFWGERRRRDYNEVRPHSSIGLIPLHDSPSSQRHHVTFNPDFF